MFLNRGSSRHTCWVEGRSGWVLSSEFQGLKAGLGAFWLTHPSTIFGFLHFPSVYRTVGFSAASGPLGTNWTGTASLTARFYLCVNHRKWVALTFHQDDFVGLPVICPTKSFYF